jgi:hypothetical protein
MGILSRRIPTTRLMAQMAAFIRNPCLPPIQQMIMPLPLSTHRRALLYVGSLSHFSLGPVVFRDQVLISSVIFIPHSLCFASLCFRFCSSCAFYLTHIYRKAVLFSPFFFVSLIVIDSKPVAGSLLLYHSSSSHSLCLFFFSCRFPLSC